MLKVWFGDNYPGGKVFKRVDMYFDMVKEKSWFNDKFIQEMIYDVDNGTKVLKDFALENPLIGGMSPDKLSGGLKTLILVKERPDEVYDVTNCGENCFKWLFEICKNEDRTVVLKYHPLISFLDPFEMLILNSNEIVTNAGDMSLKTVDYLFADENSKEYQEIQKLQDEKIAKQLQEFREEGLL